MQDPRFPKRFLELIDNVIKSRPDASEAVCAASVLIAIRYEEVTVDDLRDVMDVEGDKRWLGSMLASLARRKVIEKTGYKKTRRKTSHGRDVSVFKLTQDWEMYWPRNWSNPKARVMTTDDGDWVFVEERR